MKRLWKYIGIALFTSAILYKYKDYLFRFLGLKKFAIIYYHPDDAYAVYILHKALYPFSDVFKGSEDNPIPEEAKKYKYIIFIGGQAVNPIYRKFMEAGYLPEIKTPGQKVIKQINDYIFIAGYEAPDTYEAVKEFITKYIK